MYFWFSAYCKFKTQLLITKIGCSCRQTFHCTLNFFYSFSFSRQNEEHVNARSQRGSWCNILQKEQMAHAGAVLRHVRVWSNTMGLFFFSSLLYTHTHIRRPSEKPQTITVGFLSSGDFEFNRQVSSVKTVQFTHKTETPQTVCSLVCRYFEQQSIKKNKNKKKNVRCE